MAYTEQYVHDRIYDYELNSPVILEKDRKEADTLIRFPDIISGVLSSLHPRGSDLACEKIKHKELFEKVVMSNPKLVILESEIFKDNKENVRMIEYLKKDDIPNF